MKNYLIFLLYLASTCSVLAQTVTSSCSAPDSIKNMYRDDADRMAVRYVMNNGTSWKDSARIEPARVQQYMDALLAVYNADSLPASDTVSDLLKIHTQKTEFSLRGLSLFADTNLTWVQGLKGGNVISGDSTVDSYLMRYNLDSSFSNFELSTVNGIIEFYFSHNQNLFSLGTFFESLSGVIQSTPYLYLGGNGLNITDTTYSGFMEITYKYGWVDCIIDCWYNRYWVFRVYPDCSVEYVRSYGDKLPANIGLQKIAKASVSIFPNPFTDHLFIENLEGDNFQFQLYDISGQPMVSGVLEESREVKLPSQLPRGYYVLRLIDGSGQLMNFKLVK